MRFLSEGARDLDALALAPAGQGVPRPVQHAGEVGVFDRCPNGVAIGIRLPTPQSAVRCASEFDDLRDRQIDLGCCCADQRSRPDARCRGVSSRTTGFGPGSRHRTSDDCARQAVSAASISPNRWGREAPTVLPVVGETSRSSTMSAPADPPTDAGSFECHGLAFRRQRMTANAGTPTSAVTTPAGSSCGAMAVRATASTQTRKMEPISADAGRSRRWFEPTRARAACGRTRPTKPMAPATLTITAVIKRCCQQQGHTHPPHVHPQRRRRVLAEGKGVECAGVSQTDHEADCDHRSAECDVEPVGAAE